MPRCPDLAIFVVTMMTTPAHACSVMNNAELEGCLTSCYMEAHGVCKGPQIASCMHNDVRGNTCSYGTGKGHQCNMNHTWAHVVHGEYL